MDRRYYSLSLDTFKNNLSNGFTNLQQEEEFVDLTLAADGHLVKVHKNIIAVASPYLKQMIKTASCQAPVIFLNNVSYKVLSYLIEYIYTGEINIPHERLEEFIKVSKSLHIKGIENFENIPDYIPSPIEIDEPMNTEEINTVNNNIYSDIMQTQNKDVPLSQNNMSCHIEQIQQNEKLPVVQILSDELIVPNNNSIVNNNENMNLENIIPKYNIEINPKVNNSCSESQSNFDFNKYNIHLTVSNANQNELPINIEDITTNEIEESIENNGTTNQIDKSIDMNVVSTNQNAETVFKENIESIEESSNAIQIQYLDNVPELPVQNITDIDANELRKMSQYSITERGALQIVLNRFIYCCHHSSQGGRKRRWRCIDYRKLSCPAFLDTNNGIIVKRKGVHCHKFHDEKIYKKHELGLIFHSIESAEEARLTKC